MFEFLLPFYLWIKCLHVISVFAWMAGMFYLPRLFVYHVESVEKGSETDKLFQLMERRLIKVIINPAMNAAWLFGILLVLTPGVIDWSAVWPYTKFASVLALSGVHGMLSRYRKAFERGENEKSGRYYRMLNEVPTVLLVIIVVSIIARPF
ncbi:MULTISPECIES: protoporphyrinogen oxidase HemJ [Halocynthiibacter]|uniref:Protoporphyrinogen IX oxidase n=1 Tax=Halocynthiibacter halioticoli TaxID=2986804 RepID=A0AAE3LSB4_9RHOB|nr:MULTISPECIES: protoporphyrinogen oxidase HemJ [Halocynthiibacter]MCV6825613.1 protoporphyrinogen oxidase HemJ [Halocynthiibacter halioticoli]MCW4058614.1 protoporphyrinogen oxidase HemJ [Halocynthiibacter sp. SDUM655004]MDE0591004.1 protoporphyrinogen oxidase HemJ [Halocynthiibacter sp. C4]